MTLNSKTLAIAIFVLIFGGISFTSAMNWWHTSTTKIPVTYTEGEAAGQYNPADIRGSYNFGDVSELFGVPMQALKTAFRIPADVDPEVYQVKSLESQFEDLDVEMGTGSVRMFVAFYKGLPYELAADEETYLFPEAVALLEQQGTLTAEQTAYLETHTVGETTADSASEDLQAAQEPQAAQDQPAAVEEPSTASEPAAGEQPTSDQPVVEGEHTPADRQVTGKTTFQDLLDWGMTQEAIEALLGDQMPSPLSTIKDFSASKGQEFSGLKGSIQAAVDKLP